MEESRRHVQNAPSVQKMHEDKIPELLTKEFANSKLLAKKYSNGLIGMSINHCYTQLLTFRSSSLQEALR